MLHMPTDAIEFELDCLPSSACKYQSRFGESGDIEPIMDLICSKCWQAKLSSKFQDDMGAKINRASRPCSTYPT